MLKKLFIFFLLLCLPFFLSSVRAQEYKSIYDTHYYIDKDETAHIEMNVTFADLSSDVYIKEFGLTFPENFSIKNVVARNANGVIPTTLTKESQGYRLSVQFITPEDSSKRLNKFTLYYDQENLFKPSGNIIEVILPIPDNQDQNDTTITVHLPEGFNKKISFAKPVPSSIHQNQITWERVNSKTVYAVFGESQLYNLDLTYNLKNTENHPVYTDIAFPPDTQYQSTTIDAINPKPVLVYIDNDGNYLGRYNLLIGQTVQVSYKGTVQIFSKPQDDMVSINRNRLNSSKKYLLSAKQYWDIGDKINNPALQNLKSVQDIYNFVVKDLTYNYQRVTTGLKRLGASTILSQPTQAVCMEFTDLFVALTRERGILSREIEGYGYTQDQRLRPLSLVTDILHSWPEYFDETKEQWVPVDPTWENTSGIDYFNSFDLNHIVFAIHGNDPSIPYPAGTYKTSDSKDVIVAPTNSIPKSNLSFDIKDSLAQNVVIKATNKAEITIINTGNVFLKNMTFEIKSASITTSPKKIYIEMIPPYGKQIIPITYTASGAVRNDRLVFTSSGNIIKQIPIHIKSSFEAVYVKILLASVLASIILGLFIAHKRK
jgi:hypothetical protein